MRRRGRVIGAAAGLAFLSHALLAEWIDVRQEGEAVKPLTTQFVKRQPRLTKPLEMKKLPKPRRRQIRREMVALRVRADRKTVPSVASPFELVGRLARPKADLARITGFEATATEPPALAQAVHGTMQAKGAVDMSLEMIDLEALDTGNYQAMVIQDPHDKKNVRGFFHLAMAYPKSMRLRATHQVEDRVISGVRRLGATMNEWTSIRTDVVGSLAFDSAGFFKTPWVHLAVPYSLEPTAEETERLGQYLVRGGFFFGEGYHVDNAGGLPAYGYEYLVTFIENALRSEGRRCGRDWSHERLPNTHPLFHSYYDFDGGPVMGYAMVFTRMWGVKITHPDGMDPVVRGIHWCDRLAVITTNQMYGQCWGDWGRITIGGRAHYSQLDPTRVLQFGINTIIFALTQEGSITRQVMDVVAY